VGDGTLRPSAGQGGGRRGCVFGFVGGESWVRKFSWGTWSGFRRLCTIGCPFGEL
jgi:hypothetical protein